MFSWLDQFDLEVVVVDLSSPGHLDVKSWVEPDHQRSQNLLMTCFWLRVFVNWGFLFHLRLLGLVASITRIEFPWVLPIFVFVFQIYMCVCMSAWLFFSMFISSILPLSLFPYTDRQLLTLHYYVFNVSLLRKSHTKITLYKPLHEIKILIPNKSMLFHSHFSSLSILVFLISASISRAPLLSM